METNKGPSPNERRAMPRADAIYQIAYECFNRRGEKVGEGNAHTMNISGRGALLEMPRGVDLDASLILWVMAPFHMLLVKGNVVHSRMGANGAYHVGVRLTEVIEGSWDALEDAVYMHQSHTPWSESRADER